MSSMIAIVIPSAAGEKILKRCIDSIYQYTYEKFALCVVSQGELGAYNYLRELEKEKDNLFVHYNSFNEPGSKGYNRGIKLAYAKVPDFKALLFLDDDIIVLKALWLKKLYDHLLRNPECGIVGYKMCSLGEPDKKGRVLEMMSCCMLCTRKLVDKIGLMDENLLWHRNDSDYCRRAWQAGWSVEVVKADDNKDVSNKYLYHSHQVGTKRLKNEDKLREETYRRFDEKWKNVEIEIK